MTAPGHLQLLLTLALASVGAAAPAPPPLVAPRNVTYALLNTTALRPAPLPYDPLGLAPTWSQTSSCCGYGPFTAAAVAAASAKYGVFEASAPCGWPAMPAVGEWGYEFHNNGNGIFPLCGNLSEAGYPAPPGDRSEALARLNAYWACRAAAARAAVNASSFAPVFSMVGHYLYAGLSAAAEGPGRSIPGAEVGETINSIQLHLAAARGAARQAGGAPFVIDFSAWFDGFITDYSALRPWGAASSPSGGHSLQLFRRAYFAVFSAGASGLIVEAGAVNAFLESSAPDGMLQLSPLGAVVAELYAYTHPPPTPAAGGGPEDIRGIPYVPVALVMEQAHGMGLGWFYQAHAWDTFPLSDAEQRVGVALAALWPGSFTVQSQIGTPDSEAGFLVPSPLGDLADVLLPYNLTAAGLEAARYRAVVVAGLGAPVGAALAGELAAYVAGGGTVVLGADEAASAAAAGWLPPSLLGLTLAPGAPPTLMVTAVSDAQTGWLAGAPGGLMFVPTAVAALTTAQPLLIFTTVGGGTALAATVNAAGAGRLVLLLAPGATAAAALGMTQHLLARLRDDTSPVRLASNVTADGDGGGVQSMLARAPWGWVLTLVNNRGVTKQPNATAVVDAAQGRAVTVTLVEAVAGAPLASAWVRDGARAPPSPLPVMSGGSVGVEVEPGGLRVVGLVLQQ
jgi:hypothetical protein